MLEHPSVVLCRIVVRQRRCRRRVEHVVAHLCACERAGVEHLQHLAGVADCGEAEHADLALITQRLEGRDHLLDHLLRGQEVACAILGDRVVQMQDVGALHAKPLEARLDRRDDRRTNVALLRAQHAHLRAVNESARLQPPHHLAEVLFGHAVAVDRRRIEVGDAGVDGARKRTLLLRLRAAHHYSANRATTETEHGDFQAASTKRSRFHVQVLIVSTRAGEQGPSDGMKKPYLCLP
jgi:hypothetical protein